MHLQDGGNNMKICYIAQSSGASNPNDWLTNSTDKLHQAMEDAMSSAIDNSIVKPFHNWCYGVWNWTVNTSFPVCTTTSLIALMLYMIGVKKARKWIIIPILVYLFIQLADVMVAGGVGK